MDTDKSEILKSFLDEKLDKINQITEKIIGCSYTASNTLGCGFLEKVYENALAHELRKTGLKVSQQYEIEVYYDGVVVGKYIADLFVEDSVIVEVKANSGLDDSQKAQCLNYLKATKLRIGLLINFGKPRIEIKRVAL
ncbi:MAG: GxxExxY protein [Pyrinomonadaceae bacterium]